MRDEGAVIIHQLGVVKARRDVVDGCLRHGQQLVGLNALDSQEGINQIHREVQQVDDDVGRRRHKKSLVDIAVQRALHLASQERAKVQNRGQASSSAYDVAVLGRGRLNTSSADGDKDGEDEQATFHRIHPSQGTSASSCLNLRL